MKKYYVICQWHRNCNLDLPSRNNNPWGVRGVVAQLFDSYSEAKFEQKLWVESENPAGTIDMRESSIDCGDCIISVVPAAKAESMYA